jgi:hypothetical protein
MGQLTQSTQVPATAADAAGASEDLGFLDLLEIGMERAISVKEVLTSMSEAVETFAQRIAQRAKELGESRSAEKLHNDLPELRQLLNRAAVDMEQFAARMDKGIPILSESFSGTIDAFARAATLAKAFPPQDMQPAIEVVTKLESGLLQNQVALSLFRGSFAHMPKITSIIDYANRKVVNALNKLDKEISNEIGLTRAVRTTFMGLQSREPAKFHDSSNRPDTR